MSLSAIAIQSKWQDWTLGQSPSGSDPPHSVETVTPADFESVSSSSPDPPLDKTISSPQPEFKTPDILSSTPSPIPQKLQKLEPDPLNYPEESTNLLIPSEIKDWEDLISFRPPVSIQEETLKYKRWTIQLWYENAWINWFVQRVEDASGPISLDYYPIFVKKLPVINGTELQPEELLNLVRKDLNGFVDWHYAYFEPYNSSWTESWLSDSRTEVLGCYVHIDMRMPTPQIHSQLERTFVQAESGAVVVSDITPQHWIFSTVFTRGHRDATVDPGDWLHPVSGNREFGWKVFPGQGYIFYTQGADRISDPKRFAVNVGTEHLIGWRAFDAADSLWQSFQIRLAGFVNKHGGQAEPLERIQRIEDWELVKEKYHKPSVPWVNKLPTGESYPRSSPTLSNPGGIP